jgi:hypothetical protein
MVRFGWVRSGSASDAHARRIIGDGVIIIPPLELDHLSRWYEKIWEIGKDVPLNISSEEVRLEKSTIPQCRYQIS